MCSSCVSAKHLKSAIQSCKAEHFLGLPSQKCKVDRVAPNMIRLWRKGYRKENNCRWFHDIENIGESKEDRIRKNLERGEEEKKAARVLRKEREAAKAKKALARYKKDPDFRVLHDQVAEVFAKFLRSDVEFLKLGDVNKISLASKWCPNIDSSYDKATLICESIARRVFPKAEYSEYEGVEDAHYAYRVRDRLKKEVLVPLHKALELPEVYIGFNQWRTLPDNRVPSIVMNTYKDLFLKHDPKRFLKYLEDVKKGDSTIAAGALLPHEIISSLGDGGSSVAELQWKRMVEDLMKLGKLKDCVAVCDVSGSMEGNLMEVCVAIGLLISELSEDPWKGKVITFTAKPKLHIIEGDELVSKVMFTTNMERGLNTNFQKVFDQILKVAVDIRSVRIRWYSRDYSSDSRYSREFSSDSSYSRDYSSDSSYSLDYGKRRRGWKEREERRAEKCRRKGWETDYEAIKRKFREKGFGKVPEIVFWNLRPSEATPVTATQEGVVLLSGFSKNLMKLFFERDGIFTPLEAMELAIAGEEYKELIVYD
uniref:Plant/T31B5-30 protein n=1 Tax=Chenopodium quinoa TaxID=63459 RepID=A0A803KSW2_CHEQI